MSENNNKVSTTEILESDRSGFTAKVVDAQGEVSIRVVHSLSDLFTRASQLNK